MGSILLVGNATIDDIMVLDHYPQQDEEMRASQHWTLPGGNCVNTAMILSELGHQVSLVCSLADDPAAQLIQARLHQLGINTDLCPVFTGCQSPYSSIWINQQNGSRSITHYRDLPELPLKHLSSLDYSSYDWIHFEGRNVETLQQVLPSIKSQAKGPVSLEIEKSRPAIETLLQHIDVCMLSSHYLSQTDQTTEQLMQQCHQKNPTLSISCTLGQHGVIGMDSTSGPYQFDAVAIDRVIDTRGAGDSFNAGLIDALVKYYDFKLALQAAQNIAAEKIQHWGMTIH